MTWRLVGLLFLAPALFGCRGEEAGLRSDDAGAGQAAAASTAASDSAFAELQARGASPEAMGVDQYTSTHVFEDLPDGGRIELQRDEADPEGVAQIREHMRKIATAFAAGDFSIPGFVHATDHVPGTDVMDERREAIAYEYRELPRGGEVVITTDEAEVVGAIHEFLAFQRADHRTGDHAGHRD